MHLCASHNSQQLSRIWNKDSTFRPTYCELDENKMIKKFIGKVLSPPQPLATCSFSRNEAQHQIDQMFQPHQQGDQILILMPQST